MSHTPEEFLNEHCKNEDWDRLNECLKDSMMTNNVIEYMQLYSDMKTNQFAEEIQAMRKEIESTPWFSNNETQQEYLSRQREKACALEDEIDQLRSDKARLVEALEMTNKHVSWGNIIRSNQQLLTEMEQK